MTTEDTIAWKASHNDVSVDATMDVRIHPVSNTSTVVIIMPGIDGSVDGYENKYVSMAERIVNQQHKAVIRFSNDFISSFHWEDNLHHALEYALANAMDICGTEDITIEVVAHSAGSSVVAWLAYEYPAVRKLLLINTAKKLDQERILEGLGKFDGEAHLVFGSEDSSIGLAELLPEKTRCTVIPEADHQFSSVPLSTFIQLVDLLA